MANRELAVLAWSNALDRVGGDHEYLTEMVGCLLVDLEGHLRDLREAAEKGEHEMLEAAAKTIEDKAAAICAEALAEAARSAAKTPGLSFAREVEMQALRLQSWARSAHN